MVLDLDVDLVVVVVVDAVVVVDVDAVVVVDVDVVVVVDVVAGRAEPQVAACRWRATPEQRARIIAGERLLADHAHATSP